MFVTHVRFTLLKMWLLRSLSAPPIQCMLHLCLRLLLRRCHFDFVVNLGTAGLVVGHPADTIKLRQQTLNTTVTQTIVKTYQNEGVRGFFKGMLFPLIGTGPLNAIFFGVYSNSMRWFNQDDKLDRISTEKAHWLRHVFFSGNEQ